MHILWTANPLRSMVELAPAEIEGLRWKVRVELLSEMVANSVYDLAKPEPDALRALVRLHGSAKDGEAVYRYLYRHADDEGHEVSSGLDREVERHVAWHLAALTRKHAGDCTCLPASCLKCAAEELVGAHTIDGLGKHEASKIGLAFGASRESEWRDTRTLDEAIAFLETYEPRADFSGWEQHAPRWRAEAKGALAWLQPYRQLYLASRLTTSAPPGSRWRHLKTGGTYVVTGTVLIEATWRPGVEYVSTSGAIKDVIVRDREEFLDGRFELILPEPAAETDEE